MNAEQFERLDDHHKTEAILKAVFLADRLTKDHYIRLYDLDNFYVEVFFDDRTHLIDAFRSFRSTTAVLPYVQGLSIAV